MDTADVIDQVKERLRIVDEPRTGNAMQHPLQTILFAAIFGTMMGEDTFEDIWRWTQGHKDWLENFLEFPAGVPSHDTFCRVFRLLDPDELRQSFVRWSRALAEVDTELVALDGKTLEQSFEDGDPEKALEMVTAWGAANGLTLAAEGFEDGDELGAIETTVELLDLQDCLVTVDALGCQRRLSRKICQQGGDYLFCVKQNQGELASQIETFFEWALDDERPDDQEVPAIDHWKETDAGHGRVEEREVWWTEATDALQLQRRWPYLEGFARIVATRHVDGEAQQEVRYYISSREDVDAETVGSDIRTHWEVENKVHWVMDVTFGEDDRRMRQEHAAENMALIHRMVSNILRQSDIKDASIRSKRKMLSWNFDYFIQVLNDGAAANL